ncbi:hypothetical protein YC2023_094502 [Brassica napus]
MASSSLSTLCSSTSSSLHTNTKLSYSLSTKLSSKANVSVQFLGKRQFAHLSPTPEISHRHRHGSAKTWRQSQERYSPLAALRFA